MRDRWALMATAAMLAALGIAVRLWGLGSEPLWLDEAYSAYAADHGWAFLLHVVPRYETHPPFYYSLLHLWVGLFGDGVTALRIPGFLTGLATPPVITLAARETGSWLGWDPKRRLGFMVAAFGFACLSIPLVEMAREVRPYPVMVLVYASAIALQLRIARRWSGGEPVGGKAFVGYLALLEATLWLHNLGPLYAATLTLAFALLIVRPALSRVDWGWLVAGHLIVALLYLPGVAILADQAPNWVHHTWLRFRIDDDFFGRLETLYAAPGWPGLATILLTGLGLMTLRRTPAGWRIAAALLVAALLPVALAVALSLTVAPVFITRTMTPVAVPTMLLLAIGVAGAGTRRMLGLGGASILGASMFAADVQARLAGPMQDWYPTVAWLEKRFRPGDQVLAYPNEGALPLHYALRDKGLNYPIRAIPSDVPSFDVPGATYPTGSRGVATLPPGQLHAIAEQSATQAVPTIWLLRLGAETYDPGNVFARELHHGRYIVRSWRDGPIDIIGFRRLPEPARNPR